MTEYIDKEAVFAELMKRGHGCNYAQGVIDAIPAADVAPVVRCKDCEKWHRDCLPISGRHGCDVIRDYTNPTDYCSFGKRMDA